MLISGNHDREGARMPIARQTSVAPIWGGLCFILLYRTLPADLVLSVQLMHQYGIPVSQMAIGWLVTALPALMPLLCFIALTRRGQTALWTWLVLPPIAWLLCQFALTIIAGIVITRFGLAPPWSETLSDLLFRLAVRLWSVHVLTVLLTTLACGYACWREHRHARA
jgi:hypothetical protein